MITQKKKNIGLKESLAVIFICFMCMIPSASAVLPSVFAPSDVIAKQNNSPVSPLKKTVLLSEGFERGKMPPNGSWEVINTGTQPWVAANWKNHTGYWSACVYEWCYNEDEVLKSPVINTTQYSMVTLTFWISAQVREDAYDVQLLAGTGPIWDLNTDANTTSLDSWTKITLDVSGYGILQLSWRYLTFDSNVYGYSFYLDDIELVGETGFQVNPGGPYQEKVFNKISFSCTTYGGTPPYRFVWDFGDNRISITKTNTIEKYYRVPGEYILFVSVTDSKTNTTNANATVKILPWDFDVDILCGLGIKANITNLMAVPATNVRVYFNITGGLLPVSPNATNATVESIPARGSVLESMSPVPIGFGLHMVTVEVVDSAGHRGKAIQKVIFIGPLAVPRLIQ